MGWQVKLVMNQVLQLRSWILSEKDGLKLFIIQKIVKTACSTTLVVWHSAEWCKSLCVLCVCIVTELCLYAVGEGDARKPNRSHQWTVILWLHRQRDGKLKGRTYITVALLLFLCLLFPFNFLLSHSFITLLSFLYLFTFTFYTFNIKEQRQITFSYIRWCFAERHSSKILVKLHKSILWVLFLQLLPKSPLAKICVAVHIIGTF